MPSKKIISVLIVCIGVIVSVWLFQKKTGGVIPTVASTDAISVNKGERQVISGNDDWKKILVSASNDPISVLTSNTSTSTFDDTTQTAQLSRDFFSRYLIAKKGGAALTQEQMASIVQGTLSSPEYSQVAGAVYVPANLHISKSSDAVTVEKYKNVINADLKEKSSQVRENAIAILTSAMNSQDEKILARLDPIIALNKGLINDFLNAEVPSDATLVHLNILNSISALLADLEAMRQVIADPVRGILGIKQYNTDIGKFSTALNNMNLYFAKKLGSY
jgi:hypothetical protein